MVTITHTAALHGVEGRLVQAETDLSPGLPGFEVVGLPGSSVREARERVKAAIKNAGFAFPQKRVTVNLAPADIRKDGAAFDLPMAVGILAAMNEAPPQSLADTLFTGELSLDGALRPVPGVLPMVYGAKQAGLAACIVPVQNAEEAALVEGIAVFPADCLKAVVRHLNGEAPIPPYSRQPAAAIIPQTEAPLDFADVRGQESVKRALEIAAAGGHNLLMIGPPGSGKTMMAKRVPSILPDLTFEESLAATKIYSVAGLLKDGAALMTARPFRAPHHTISYAALTGGGRVPKPGEISLAHGGVLFLDELPEFQKGVLEMLRQPMEEGAVVVSRVGGTIEYPADFMLIAGMNPCPCGFFPDTDKCGCTRHDVARYLGKLSGPLLDRIDIQIEAPRVRYEQLEAAKAEPSETIRARVRAARAVQRERGIALNGGLSPAQIERYCALSDKGAAMLKAAFDKMGLSMRAYHKILKVSRTIADLDGAESIAPAHVAEAIGYRSLDRKYWK